MVHFASIPKALKDYIAFLQEFSSVFVSADSFKPLLADAKDHVLHSCINKLTGDNSLSALTDQ